MEAGGTEAGALYARLLHRVRPDAEVSVGRVSARDRGIPPGATLGDFDGIVWTGSNLSVGGDAPAVRRHVELAREAFAAGVPSFGSCYAAQLAVVAAGGACRTNPKGREFGIARDITLNDAGRAHPMFAGKAPVFDAWTSHADEVATLPPGARVLASNAWSAVQAVEVRSGGAEFWAVQYHPEYDPHEVACLAALRAPELLAQQSFADREELDAWRTAIRGGGPASPVPPALADPDAGGREVTNWIEHQVLAHRRP